MDELQELGALMQGPQGESKATLRVELPDGPTVVVESSSEGRNQETTIRVEGEMGFDPPLREEVLSIMHALI